LSPKIHRKVRELDRTEVTGGQPNYPVIQLRYGLSQLVVLWINQAMQREQPLHIRQVIGTDQQFARPIGLRSLATGNSR
jgi:hypothetical protein